MTDLLFTNIAVLKAKAPDASDEEIHNAARVLTALGYDASTASTDVMFGALYKAIPWWRRPWAWLKTGLATGVWN